MTGFPQLILFDAAGTLIEPAEPVETTYHRHFSDFGWEVDPGKIRRNFQTMFIDLPEPSFTDPAQGDLAEKAWWRELVERTGRAAGIDTRVASFGRCFEELFRYYASGAAWSVFPEAVEVLERMRSSGTKLAVVSNFDRRLHQILRELDLSEYFDRVITSADVGARKPSPAILKVALEDFSVLPENSCLVGDSEAADQAAAKAAGVPVFILERPKTGLADFEKWIIENFC
jgi:putative hydrolase of the HAD superfamily